MGIFDYGTSGSYLNNPSLADWAGFTASSVAGYATVSSGTYTLSNKNHLLVCTAAVGVTLPSASTVTGREMIIKNTSAGTVTINRTDSAVIDGSATSISLAGKGSISLYSDGTNWFVNDGFYTDSSDYSYAWDNKTAAFVRIIRPSDAAITFAGNTTVSGTSNLTGTVTLSSDLNVDSNTLFVNSTSNRVGILTGSPASAFHVSGNSQLAGNVNITGSAYFASDLFIDTNTLVVDSTNNRVGVVTSNPASALHVIGNSLFAGNASISGSVAIASNISVGGTSSFAGSVTLPSTVYGWATNLLSMNVATDQSSTSGFSSLGLVTIASSTDYALTGTNSLKATLTSGVFPWVGVGAGSTNSPVSSGSISVTPGQPYTFVASLYSPAMTLSMRATIYWWTSAGNVAATTATNAGTAVALSAGWTERRITAVAPSNAAYASIIIEGISAGSTSDVFYVDKIGFWEGAGGTWAIPGRPINAIGTYTDESVGRRIFTWDTVNSRWQMTYGDTGWREVTSATSAITNLTCNRFLIRRIGNQLFFDVACTSTAAVSGLLYSAGTGWTSDRSFVLVGDAYSATQQPAMLTQSGGYYWRTWTATGSQRVVSGVTTTSDAWPTSLSGSAVGSIPT